MFGNLLFGKGYGFSRYHAWPFCCHAVCFSRASQRRINYTSVLIDIRQKSGLHERWRGRIYRGKNSLEPGWDNLDRGKGWDIRQDATSLGATICRRLSLSRLHLKRSSSSLFVLIKRRCRLAWSEFCEGEIWSVTNWPGGKPSETTYHPKLYIELTSFRSLRYKYVGIFAVSFFQHDGLL
ncbi:hypothetical protein AOQ84DRAFT_21110 [Glonium stellatum]|uniref:Uncharacterized protein n=1 Tax=Glonium stellatum TaxID=574774 RepID=A0A8E2F390_9PEZI|nr:hypothetical protein AOQ84DRAFT_21110 [Glonium stellatum]